MYNMSKIEAKVTNDGRLLMLVFDCLAVAVILLPTALIFAEAMESEQQQHRELIFPANITLKAPKSFYLSANNSRRDLESSIYTILVNSTPVTNETYGHEQVQDLDTSESIMRHAVRPFEKRMRLDNSTQLEKHPPPPSLVPKLTSKSQLFLSKIKSKRKLKFIKDKKQQQVVDPIRKNDLNASSSNNHEEWIDYDESSNVEAPEGSIGTTIKPTNVPQSFRTTRAPRALIDSTNQPVVLQVKKESSEAKEEEDRPMVSKSSSSTTTVGDGKKRSKIVSKSASLPPGLRRRIIEQFIKNGGDPQNIVVSDSTITTTSQSKKKTITTVYKIVPNSAPTGKKLRIKIKPVAMNTAELGGVNLSEVGDDQLMTFNQQSKGDILSQLLGQPKRAKGDKMKGRKVKKIMVTRTEIPHNSFLADEMPGLPESDNNKMMNKGEQELGEFYQGPHESIFGLNENPSQYDELQKNAILELDKMTDPAISMKGQQKGGIRMSPHKINMGQVSKDDLESKDLVDMSPITGNFPQIDGEKKYEFMDEHEANKLPPSKSTNSLLSEFKELKEPKVANKKESQHQFGSKVNILSQDRTNKKVEAGDNAPEQRTEASPESNPDERSSSEAQDKSSGSSKSLSEPTGKQTKPTRRAKTIQQAAKTNWSSKKQSSPTNSSPPTTTTTSTTTTTTTTTSTTTTTRAPRQSNDSPRQKSRSNDDKHYGGSDEQVLSTLSNATLNQPTGSGAKTHNIMMLIDFGPTNGHRGQVNELRSRQKSQSEVEQDGPIVAQQVAASNSRKPQRALSSKRQMQQNGGFVPMISHQDAWQPVGSRKTAASSKQMQQAARTAPTVNVQIYNNAPNRQAAHLPDFGESSAFSLDDSQQFEQQHLYDSAASDNELGAFKLMPPEQQDLQPTQLTPSIILRGESASTNQLVNRVIDELAMASDHHQHQEQGQPLYPMTTSVRDAGRSNDPGGSLEDDDDDDDDLIGLHEPARDSLQSEMRLTSQQQQQASFSDLPAASGHFGSQQSSNNRFMALDGR